MSLNECLKRSLLIQKSCSMIPLRWRRTSFGSALHENATSHLHRLNEDLSISWVPRQEGKRCKKNCWVQEELFIGDSDIFQIKINNCFMDCRCMLQSDKSWVMVQFLPVLEPGAGLCSTASPSWPQSNHLFPIIDLPEAIRICPPPERTFSSAAPNPTMHWLSSRTD